MTAPDQRVDVAQRPDLASMSWATHGWYRSLSYYFAVSTSHPELAEYVDTVIGRFATEQDPAEELNPPTPGVPANYHFVDNGPDVEIRYALYFNGVIISGSINAAYVFDHFFWHVNAETARRTGDFVLIHAGAVATPDGKGVLIPGVSGTGKSTLVSGLLSAGFTYYSDEAAAIDPIGGLLHGYPKSITLKDRTVFETFPNLPAAQTDETYVENRWYIVPSQVREDIFGPPVKVRHVVLSKFAPGEPTAISPVSRASAALALGRNAINIGRYKARILPLLSDLVADAVCYSVVSGDLKEAAAVISETTGSG